MKLFKRASFALLLFAPLSVFAASSDHPLRDLDVDRSEASLQRGFHVVNEVCMLCHNLKYIKYRNLKEIGFSEEEVNQIRGEKEMADFLKTTLPESAAEFHFGRVPPDLSLMAKARKKGPRYIYTLLTGYVEKDETHIDNLLFPGIKMPDVLGYTIATEPGEKEAVEQKAKDAVAFLEWAADPKAPLRREMGVYVIGYFLLLTLLLFLIKQRVWARLKH